MSPRYQIRVAAEMAGLSPLVIRAWERRYGILEPERTSGGYRTFSTTDIEVLKRLKELTDEGMAISQAAALVPGIRRELKDRPALKVPVEAQLQRWQSEIISAAKRADQRAVERIFDEAFNSMAPVRFFEDLVTPLMREVGDRWHAGQLAVFDEHLISAVVRDRLVTLFVRAPRRSKKHVVCACPPEEAHEFGLLGAAIRFRHAGWRVTLLGAKTPIDQLLLALKTANPDLVAISLVQDTGARKYLDALAAEWPDRKPVVLGGQGASELVEPARKHGFRVIKSEADWNRILGRTR